VAPRHVRWQQLLNIGVLAPPDDLSGAVGDVLHRAHDQRPVVESQSGVGLCPGQEDQRLGGGSNRLHLKEPGRRADAGSDHVVAELVGDQADPTDRTGKVRVSEDDELVAGIGGDELFPGGADFTAMPVVPASPEREQQRLTARRVVHEPFERDGDLGAFGGVGWSGSWFRCRARARDGGSGRPTEGTVRR
jgi:hypothetical protein